MATSAVPMVIDALVTAATGELPNVAVSDGFGISDTPGDFLMIGVEDPESDNPESATAEQSWAHVGGTARDETGEITCCAVSWNGDSDAKAARDGAYAICTALENYLRANKALGLATVLWTSFGTSQQLSQVKDASGALAMVTFRVQYQARI